MSHVEKREHDGTLRIVTTARTPRALHVATL
jgi:hypothetical protein